MDILLILILGDYISKRMLRKVTNLHYKDRERYYRRGKIDHSWRSKFASGMTRVFPRDTRVSVRPKLFFLAPLLLVSSVFRVNGETRGERIESKIESKPLTRLEGTREEKKEKKRKKPDKIIHQVDHR